MNSGAEMGRRSEKSSFSQTFSLLRQYIKENGCSADLGLGMPSRSIDPAAIGKRDAYKPPITMSLLPGVEISGDERAGLNIDVSSRENTRSMELYPNPTGFGPFVPSGDTKTNSPEKPPLTIFYGGKVLVFDNFPAEKAEDLMQLASKCSKMDAAAQSLTPSTIPPATFASIPLPKFSDLPIARKASLHRFLEKRRDRIIAKAPYQMMSNNGMKNVSVLKEKDISQPWLGLGNKISS